MFGGRVRSFGGVGADPVSEHLTLYYNVSQWRGGETEEGQRGGVKLSVIKRLRKSVISMSALACRGHQRLKDGWAMKFIPKGLLGEEWMEGVMSSLFDLTAHPEDWKARLLFWGRQGGEVIQRRKTGRELEINLNEIHDKSCLVYPTKRTTGGILELLTKYADKQMEASIDRSGRPQKFLPRQCDLKISQKAYSLTGTTIDTCFAVAVNKDDDAWGSAPLSRQINSVVWKQPTCLKDRQTLRHFAKTVIILLADVLAAEKNLKAGVGSKSSQKEVEFKRRKLDLFLEGLMPLIASLILSKIHHKGTLIRNKSELQEILTKAAKGFRLQFPAPHDKTLVKEVSVSFEAKSGNVTIGAKTVAKAEASSKEESVSVGRKPGKSATATEILKTHEAEKAEKRQEWEAGEKGRKSDQAKLLLENIVEQTGEELHMFAFGDLQRELELSVGGGGSDEDEDEEYLTADGSSPYLSAEEESAELLGAVGGASRVVGLGDEAGGSDFVVSAGSDYFRTPDRSQSRGNPYFLEKAAKTSSPKAACTVGFLLNGPEYADWEISAVERGSDEGLLRHELLSVVGGQEEFLEPLSASVVGGVVHEEVSRGAAAEGMIRGDVRQEAPPAVQWRRPRWIAESSPQDGGVGDGAGEQEERRVGVVSESQEIEEPELWLSELFGFLEEEDEEEELQGGLREEGLAASNEEVEDEVNGDEASAIVGRILNRFRETDLPAPDNERDGNGGGGVSEEERLQEMKESLRTFMLEAPEHVDAENWTRLVVKLGTLLLDGSRNLEDKTFKKRVDRNTMALRFVSHLFKKRGHFTGLTDKEYMGVPDSVFTYPYITPCRKNGKKAPVGGFGKTPKQVVSRFMVNVKSKELISEMLYLLGIELVDKESVVNDLIAFGKKHMG